MADIEYVIPGQAVRASTINSIIDSLGGPYTPASEPDIGFERTPYGSIFTSQTNVEGAPAYIAPQFLDVAWGPSLSGQQELMMNLGRDLQTALKLLPSNPTAVFFRDFSGSTASKSSMLKLSAESFEPNGAGKYFDGWIGTGIYSLEKASGGEQPVAEEAGDTSTAVLDGCLYMYDMQGDDGNACVIANSTSYKPFESELKSITGWKSVTMKSKTAIATQTSASLKSGTASAGASLIRIHNAAPEIQTENYLFKLRANVETREEGGSKQKRAVIEYWDNADTTNGGVQWNTYRFEDQGRPLGGGAAWIEISATEWAEKIPEFDLTAWLKVTAAGPSTPELTSEYLTQHEWTVTLEKRDDEACWIGGLARGGLGSRRVVAYYPIGRIHNHSLYGHDNLFVEQCMLGSLNTLDMSWSGDGGGGGGSIGDDSQRFTADSLLSSAEMSSLTRDAYKYKYVEELSDGQLEEREATGYYFSLYNFKHAEGAIDLSLALSNDYKLPDRYKILVRDNQEKLGQTTKPVLKYATLSVEVPAMSVDSQMSGTNSWSVQLSAKQKGHGVTQLFNFTKEQEDGTYKFDKQNASLSDDNLILARVKGDDGYKLKYMKLEVNGLSDVVPLSNMVFDLSADVQADTKVQEAKTKSVDKGKYTATVNHIDLSGNVKQEQVDATYFKLYQFDGDEAIDKDKLASLNDYTVLVKKADGESKELHYMALSSFRDLSADTQDEQLNQKSIEKVQNGKMLQLYKFNQSGNAKISLDKDHTSTEDGLEVLVRSTKDGIKQLDYASLSIAFPKSRDLSADTEVTSSGTKSIDCSLSVLSLHNFKGSSNDIHLKIEDGNNKTPAGTSLLVRKGNELKYADLQVTFPQLSDQTQKQQLSGMFKADAASAAGLSSISEMWDGKTKLFSTYKFNDNEYHVSEKKDAGANADVLVRDRDRRVLKYVDLSSFTGDISCDSDSLYSEQFTEKRASLEKARDGLYQLYGFDLTGSTATVTLTPAQPKLSNDWQLVTRHKQGDTTNLIYADLSVAYHKGDDASIQEDKQDKSKLQLLDWASHSTVSLNKVDGIAYEALVKDVNTGKLAYASLDISSSGSTYVDSEKSSVARSLEKVVPENGDPYLMVNGFDTAENVPKSDLSTHQDDYDVLLRHRNGNLVEMSYASLKDIQLSGATASEMNYNWMWHKDAEGNYVKPGDGKMVGYYLYGNVMRYVSKTIPAGSGFLHIVITYGTPSTTEGGSTPASESFQWKSSYYTSPSLTSISIPLWYHNGTDPTLDMRAGLFTVPVYA